MAGQHSDTVPADMWICGVCTGGNLIALTDEVCPVCSHQRDNCCIGPGKPYPTRTGLFPGNPEYQFQSLGFSNYHGHSHAYAPTPSFSQTTVDSSFHNATDFDDMWTCPECEAEKNGWCEQCPIGGRGTKPASMRFTGNGKYDAPAYITYGPAGSQGEGYWECGNCGASNSGLTSDWCPECGVSR